MHHLSYKFSPIKIFLALSIIVIIELSLKYNATSFLFFLGWVDSSWCYDNSDAWNLHWILLFFHKITKNGDFSNSTKSLHRPNQLRFVLPILSQVTMPMGSFSIHNFA